MSGFIVTVHDRYRGDTVYPRHPPWMIGTTNTVSLDVFETMTLIQRVLRDPDVDRIIIKEVTHPAKGKYHPPLLDRRFNNPPDPSPSQEGA